MKLIVTDEIQKTTNLFKCKKLRFQFTGMQKDFKMQPEMKVQIKKLCSANQ